MCIFCDGKDMDICSECLKNEEKIKIWHRLIVCRMDFFRDKKEIKKEYKNLMKLLGIDYED